MTSAQVDRVHVTEMISYDQGTEPAPVVAQSVSGGRPATVIVPGGPYNLTANSGGGSQSVRIATDPTALPSITITSGGGSLQVEPPGGAG